MKQVSIEKVCDEHNLTVWALGRIVGVSVSALIDWEEDPGSVCCKDRLKIESVIDALENGKLGERPHCWQVASERKKRNEWEEHLREEAERRERAKTELAVQNLVDILLGIPLDFEFGELDSDLDVDLKRFTERL